MDPQEQRLLDLDRRYRLILHSTDHVYGGILDTVLPEIKQGYADVETDIEDLRETYPHLLRKLEGLYRDAHPDREAATGDLIDFAYREHLLLTGDPYQGEFRAPD